MGLSVKCAGTAVSIATASGCLILSSTDQLVLHPFVFAGIDRAKE
jgi:hypothetical protein